MVASRSSHLQLLLYAVPLALGRIHSPGCLGGSVCGVAQRLLTALFQDDALEAAQALLVGHEGLLLPQRVGQGVLCGERLQSAINDTSPMTACCRSSGTECAPAWLKDQREATAWLLPHTQIYNAVLHRLEKYTHGENAELLGLGCGWEPCRNPAQSQTYLQKPLDALHLL